MRGLLELIFQGFFEWIYGLILEAWEFFSGNLIDLMSMDFAYLQTHIPVLPVIRQSMLAVGWALLLGNLVFQALRAMMAGLGFEAEDPKLLFTRTFVFSFLLLASPQICELCLDMTSTVIHIMELPTAVNIDIIHESAFDGLACAWLLVFICGVVIMFQSFKLIAAMAERYFILAVLTICAPLAFGMGGNRDTNDIFAGWCRMYGSMCLLMVLNVVFVKMLLSVLSMVPTGLSVLPWMVLIVAVVKAAKRADGIVSRIGLNPAMTGDSLGRTFPGVLTYMVTRTAVTHATKALGKTLGRDNGGKVASGGGNPKEAEHGGKRGFYGGPPNAGYGSGRGGATTRGRKNPITVTAEEWESTQQAESSQTAAAHTTEKHTTTKEQSAGTASKGAARTEQKRPAAANPSRKSSVPPEQRRSPGQGRATAAAPSSRNVSPKERPTANGTAGIRAETRGSDLTSCRQNAATGAPRTGAAKTPQSEKTTQAKGATRYTQRTDAQSTRARQQEKSTVSTSERASKTDTAGTNTQTSTRQTTRPERQGRNAPASPLAPAAPKEAQASGTARQEQARRSAARTSAKGASDPPRSGTAGIASETISRQTAREERHSRNTSTQRQSAVSTAQPAPTAPARQESKPASTPIPAESGRTPPIRSGTAGTGVAQTTRLSVRDERQRRNAPDTPPAATTTAKAPDTARQERQPRPSAEPRSSGPSLPIRSGMAGTAPAGADTSQTRRTASKPVSSQKQIHIPNGGTGDKPVTSPGVKAGQKAARKSAVKRGRKKHGKS